MEGFKSYTCPNCGANTTKTDKCEYCDSLLVRPNINSSSDLLMAIDEYKSEELEKVLLKCQTLLKECNDTGIVNFSYKGMDLDLQFIFAEGNIIELNVCDEQFVRQYKVDIATNFNIIESEVNWVNFEVGTDLSFGAQLLHRIMIILYNDRIVVSDLSFELQPNNTSENWYIDSNGDFLYSNDEESETDEENDSTIFWAWGIVIVGALLYFIF